MLAIPSRRSPAHQLGFLFVALIVFVVALIAASPGFAHNSLDAAVPPDSSELPFESELLLRFVNEVPLETMSVDVTGASGQRSTVDRLRHGQNSREVIVPLAGVAAGSASLRWRLVGPDGHVVTDRLRYTILPRGSSAALGVAPAEPSPVELSEPQGSGLGAVGQWLVRVGGYLALLAALGVLITARFVWPGAWAIAQLRSVATVAMGVVSLLAFIQLIQLAATIEQRQLWRSFGSLDVAIGTDVGKALFVRVVIAAGATLLLARGMTRLRGGVGDLVLGGIGVALLATWAAAGHAASLRWAAVGLPIDVLHYLAAAAWVGGLAVVGGVALNRLEPEEARVVVGRFSRVAAGSVAILAITGLLATVRFLDSPGALTDSHNQILVVKLGVVGLMLAAGNVNRKRVLRWAGRTDAPRRRQVSALRRAMTTELALGIVVLAVTAVLVVTRPSTGS